MRIGADFKFFIDQRIVLIKKCLEKGYGEEIALIHTDYLFKLLQTRSKLLNIKHMNKAQFIGHIGKDASINVQGERKAINFSVAVTKKYKNADGVPVEKTTWISCAIWRKASDEVKIAQYILKGTQVFVEGEISASGYKNDKGEFVSSLNLLVNDIKLLASVKKEEIVSEKTESSEALNAAEDALPF
jgi:single-strand DNA-binding protein